MHVLLIMYLLMGGIVYVCTLQSIPSDMEFDPNSNPPCYKTKEEVIHCSVMMV